MITSEDIFVGAVLICTNVNLHRHYTVGRTYTVNSALSNHYVFRIKDDRDYPSLMTLYMINDDSRASFVPLTRLSEKEQFTYHITGNLPERYHA